MQERDIFINDIAEAIKDPTAKNIEAFYNDYAKLVMLRQIAESPLSIEEDGSSITQFLSSEEGKTELAKWSESYARSFAKLDGFVTSHSRGAHYSYRDWDIVTDAIRNALNPLAEHIAKAVGR